MKSSLKEGEFVAHLDFAENYTFVIQREVQSHYFLQEQCTIHPIVVYHESGHFTLVVVSDELKHDAAFVTLIVEELVQHISSKFPRVDKIRIWSDGCVAQYKNKFNFFQLTQTSEKFGIQCDWNFFESCHGKGPCDGVGGTVKRAAARAALMGRSIVNAHEFFQ